MTENELIEKNHQSWLDAIRFARIAGEDVWIWSDCYSIELSRDNRKMFNEIRRQADYWISPGGSFIKNPDRKLFLKSATPSELERCWKYP
jgi:hypothetical protein